MSRKFHQFSTKIKICCKKQILQICYKQVKKINLHLLFHLLFHLFREQNDLISYLSDLFNANTNKKENFSRDNCKNNQI